MARKDEIGLWGETYARQWLEQAGWRTLSQNWRCPAGEVDIVAVRGDDLVFFEVKTRTSQTFGHPVEALSAAKISRMRVVAGQWLAAHRNVRGRIRLDLIAILRERGRLEIEHVEAVG